MWRSLVSRLVRDQEAMGSSPVTPTRNLESAFAGSRFFIDGGIRRAAPIRRRRKQVSGKHLLSEKVSAAWLLTKQRSLFFCCAQVSVLFLILQYKKLVTSAHGVSRAHSDSLQADGLPVLPR